MELPTTAGAVIEDGNSDNGGSANEVVMPGEDPQNEMITEKAKTGKFKAFGAKMKEKRANNIAKITNRIQEVKTKRSEAKKAKED